MEPLTDAQRDRYAWQIDIPGFGPAGQAKLCAASALVSRCGGLGGSVCYNLAAAGIGKLVLAHAGAVELGDLNRQILMTHDWLGKPRVQCAARRLRELNPDLRIEAVDANIGAENARELVEQVDIVFDCAPRFSERFLMNRECVRQNKPMVEAIMPVIIITMTSSTSENPPRPEIAASCERRFGQIQFFGIFVTMARA